MDAALGGAVLGRAPAGLADAAEATGEAFAVGVATVVALAVWVARAVARAAAFAVGVEEAAITDGVGLMAATRGERLARADADADPGSVLALATEMGAAPTGRAELESQPAVPSAVVMIAVVKAAIVIMRPAVRAGAWVTVTEERAIKEKDIPLPNHVCAARSESVSVRSSSVRESGLSGESQRATDTNRRHIQEQQRKAIGP